MSDAEWTVLRKFDSEGEARVVESFLRAKGFEVQLLGAHSHQAVSAVRGFQAGAGMRLVVRETDATAAEQAMKDAEQAGSPEFNAGKPPPIYGQRDYAIIALLVALALIVALAYWLK